MKRILTLLLLASLQSAAQTGDLPFYPGAQSASMGGSQVAYTSVWAAHHNPGLLPLLKSPVVAIGVENRFLLAELNSEGLAFATPLKTGAFGVAITNHGYSQFRRSRVGLSYGLRLGSGVSAGVSLQYDMLAIGNNYGSASAISGTLGVAAELSESVVVGASVFNPFRAQFSENVDEIIPSVMAFGASYTFSEKLIGQAEVEMDILMKPGLKTGLQWHPHESIYLAFGMRTLPQSYSFGFGYKVSHFRVDLAAWMHPVLGVSPSLSLEYNFGKAK